MNVLITKQLNIFPLPEVSVQYIPLLEPNNVYISEPPFLTSYQAYIADFPDMLDFTAWCFLLNENLLVTGARKQRDALSVDCAQAQA